MGLGANLGRPASAIRAAARRLSRDLHDSRLSPLFRTSPVGGPPQPDYVNAVLVGKTRLGARALLGRLTELERAAGRRPAPRNAPRPLDLDLLLYGARRIASRGLRVPHPRLAGRLFVLVPLAALAPRRVVPGTGRTVSRLLREAKAGSAERVVRLGTGDRLSGPAAPRRAAPRGAASPRG
ncbi:MAG TPA: 2-amino-4-hydroxy-6-hydroxymethyldihydropteridine diphosphokinase [Thermoanaerobaculia bacterium]|nr:2-amino-4-hydroxy-6-hydroxymethyldihydropteridine diphosphokinase [Thermoanaerobaculia bacterium]